MKKESKMQEKIGFNVQNNLYGECGQFALIHSLLLLGIPVSLKEAHKYTLPRIITSIRGTDYTFIKKAIKYYECQAIEYKHKNGLDARDSIDTILQEGLPIIISTDNYSHWAVLAGKAGMDEYIWIDSSENELIGAWKWADIEEWIRYEENNKTEYYFIAVKPKNENQIKYSLVPQFEKTWELLRDQDLCEWWGYYLEDLLEIFHPYDLNEHNISSDEFFEKYMEFITDKIDYYYLYTPKKYIEWELSNYEKVAKAYNYFISQEYAEKAGIDLAIILTLLATGNG
jgi:hypothetical protein